MYDPRAKISHETTWKKCPVMGGTGEQMGYGGKMHAGVVGNPLRRQVEYWTTQGEAGVMTDGASNHAGQHPGCCKKRPFFKALSRCAFARREYQNNTLQREAPSTWPGGGIILVSVHDCLMSDSPPRSRARKSGFASAPTTTPVGIDGQREEHVGTKMEPVAKPTATTKRTPNEEREER